MTCVFDFKFHMLLSIKQVRFDVDVFSFQRGNADYSYRIAPSKDADLFSSYSLPSINSREGIFFSLLLKLPFKNLATLSISGNNVAPEIERSASSFKIFVLPFSTIGSATGLFSSLYRYLSGIWAGVFLFLPYPNNKNAPLCLMILWLSSFGLTQNVECKCSSFILDSGRRKHLTSCQVCIALLQLIDYVVKNGEREHGNSL